MDADRRSAVVAPSHEDPVVRALSPVIGGPRGAYAGGSWWTPVRVLLVLVTLTFALGLVQKAPCAAQAWQDGTTRYTQMCYSDIPYLYSGRGFAQGEPPYLDNGGRYEYLEYPVLTGAFAYGAAVLTHAVFGEPDLAGVSPDRVGGDQGVLGNIVPFTVVNALLLFGCALIAVWALAGVHRGRPWDAALFALAPALALSSLINWDLLVIALLATALLAWSRSRPLLAGVLIGLGTAAKLYPLFVLGPILVLCLRSRRMRAFWQALAGALAAWAVTNLPVAAANFEGWAQFWTFNSDRGADLGSLWYAWTLAGHEVSAHTINLGSWVFLGGSCAAVAGLALFAPRRPRLPQLVFLVVAAFLLVNKVYSPQYMLWLLPLAALARPRWRDLLIWQAGEIVYFAAIWLHLSGDLAPAASDATPLPYILSILVRVAGLLWLSAVVLRDIWQPWNDPVRADGVTDDPAGGVLDDALDLSAVARR
ncbi:MAG: glycosyltransferase family 87 protein [Nocardioidaceae bacterium]